MSAIDHKEEAEAMMLDGDDSGKPTGIQMSALIHATLYLAEQQRIANLIALWTVDETIAESLTRNGVNFAGVLEQIREGLGLA